MCKEMHAIMVDTVVGKKRIIGTNGGPRKRRGTRGKRLPDIHRKFCNIFSYLILSKVTGCQFLITQKQF
jgi:hypothetical protein